MLICAAGTGPFPAARGVNTAVFLFAGGRMSFAAAGGRQAAEPFSGRLRAETAEPAKAAGEAAASAFLGCFLRRRTQTMTTAATAPAIASSGRQYASVSTKPWHTATKFCQPRLSVLVSRAPNEPLGEYSATSLSVTSTVHRSTWSSIARCCAV